MLLVCKRWCRVGLENCPAWWRSVQVFGGAYSLEGPTTWGLKQKDRSEAVQLLLLKPAILAGFTKVAPHVRQLDFSNINIELAIGGMGALKSLVFDPMSPQPGGVPLSYLTPLSALTQLCHLDMCLVGCHGSLPPAILPRLQCLTHLGLDFCAPTKGPPQRVSWGGDANGSARLHVLRLCNAWLPPEEATLASLGQLEELQLLGDCFVPTALPTVLHSLSGLKWLEVEETRREDNGLPQGSAEDGVSDDQWYLQLAAGCSQLRGLRLPRGAVLGLEVPPGALQHLSTLSIDDPNRTQDLHMAGSWAKLPSLECLQLAGLSVHGLTCATEGLTGIKRLDMGAFDLAWEHCQLSFPHLTWLAMSDGSLQSGPPPKRILRRLHHLSVHPSSIRSFARPAGLQQLPRNLSQATSLRVLDLSNCDQVMLREVDADALEQLKSLRRLEVNEYQRQEVMEFLRKQLPELEIVEVELEP
ncbi:hypothetical protein N2152v2_003089 [Parachlorella kessleri]